MSSVPLTDDTVLIKMASKVYAIYRHMHHIKWQEMHRLPVFQNSPSNGDGTFQKKNKFWKCSYTLHRLTFYKQKAFNFDQFDKNAKTVESKIWNLYEQQHVFFSI